MKGSSAPRGSPMSIEINGLRLPPTLEAAMRDGTWRTPDSFGAWTMLFPRDNAHHAKLYSLKLMNAENASWPIESSPSYLGVADGRHPPGDIDPAKSLLIGDLGPDQLIALDYRAAPGSVPVLYLSEEKEGSRWIRIAHDIEAFLSGIGLMDRGAAPQTD